MHCCLEPLTASVLVLNNHIHMYHTNISNIGAMLDWESEPHLGSSATMITRRVLRELLQRPLGPYHDKDVLSEECRLSGQSKLVLYSFVLEHEGRVIGLDQSETPLEGRREDHRRFRFRGTLKIGDPDWLSDWGVKLVEAELDLRWSERAMREGERRGPPLTLKELFGNKLLKCSGSALRDGDDECELLLRIQGERGLPAVFMRASRVKDELLWTSKDQ